MESIDFRLRLFTRLPNKKAVVFLLAMLLASVAANDAMSNEPVSPSSGDDMTGDLLLLRGTMGGFDLVRDGAEEESIAPSGTKLRVNADGRFNDKTGDEDMLIVRVKSVRCEQQHVKKKVNGAENEEQKNVTPLSYVGFDKFSKCPEGELVKEGEVYAVKKDDLESYGYNRSGWTYGVLLVPYKYHRHDKSFSSETTVGPYIGYRQGWIGFDVSLVGSIGLASLTVPTTAADGSTSTSTLQGFSMAVGVISSFRKNKSPIQFGLLIGRDWAGSNSATPYEHEGKTWLGAQIGFAFTKN